MEKFNFFEWLTELLQLHESMTTHDIYSLLNEYLNELYVHVNSNLNYVQLNTVYMRLYRLASDDMIIGAKGDNTVWWSLPKQIRPIKSWDYYVDFMVAENHVLLGSISKKHGGSAKGNGFGWAMKRFLEFMKEVHNNE